MFRSNAPTSIIPPSRRNRLRVERLEDRTNPSVGTPFLIVDYVGPTPQPTRAITELTSASCNSVAVAVWVESGSSFPNSAIRGRLYNPNGSAKGPVFTIFNASATETAPAVAMDDLGNWIVTFERKEPGSTQKNVWVARYNANGILQGNFLPIANTIANEHQPSIAVDPAGNFVVTYTRDSSPTQSDVFFRRYSNNATFLNAAEVSALSGVKESSSRVARNANSEFVVTFLRNSSALLRKFDATGKPQWIRTVNASATGTDLTVSMDSLGNSLVGYTTGTAASFVRRFFPNGSFQPAVTAEAFAGGSPNSTPPIRLSTAATGRLRGGSASFIAYTRADNQDSSSIVVKETSSSSNHIASFSGPRTRPTLSINANGTFFITFGQIQESASGNITAFVGVFGTSSV